MRETTKEVEVGGSRYRLTKMSAEAAARIFNLLMSTALKAQSTSPAEAAAEAVPDTDDPEKRAAGMVGFLWMLAALDLDEKVYLRIQHQCLFNCAKLDGPATVPLKMADGRWAAKELEADAPAVNQLVVEALQFNIAPFFLAGLSPAAAPATGQ